MYKNNVAGLVCKKNLPLQFARCPSQSFSKDHRFSLGTPVSSTNKTDCHDITEILLKMALNTINLNQTKRISFSKLYIMYSKSLSSCTNYYWVSPVKLTQN
jgi:hypothetical protein